MLNILKNRPLFAQYAITHRCNSRCPSCEYWRKRGPGRELALEEISRLADELWQFGIRVLTVTGGEPFLRDDATHIIRLFQDRGFRVTINTNAMCIDEGLIRELSAMDRLHIVVSLDSLDRNNLTRDTLIIFTSDHGEEFLEHGDLYHIKLYDEILHVPLIMRIPGATVKDTRITSATRSIDIFPTIFEILGVDNNLQLSGTSLVPAIHGREFNPYPVYSELLGVRYSAIARLKGTTYKMYLDGDTWQLFDLDHDPLERENLVGTVLGVENQLRDMLTRHIVDAASVPGFHEADEPWIDDTDPWNEQRLNELRALGYL